MNWKVLLFCFIGEKIHNREIEDYGQGQFTASKSSS